MTRQDLIRIATEYTLREYKQTFKDLADNDKEDENPRTNN